ncbi:hypothetical protein [Gimesia maris]|uniref:hypothetical protein n=1 Tax=Gimesia maris TaxID=122 RepID=UPI0030D931DE|tara:strand:+ start:4356 stop:4778 length:423 start_codon:yes stop_codon:yes gene_type:complete
MREMMVGLMLAPVGLLLLYLIYLQFQYLAFKKQVPQFRSEQDIDRLKRLAAGQMSGVPTALKIVNYFPVLIWITGILLGDLTWSDLFFFVVLPYLVLGAFCIITGSPPEKIGQFPVEDQNLETQRDHIVHVWIHETHPDW